VLVSLTKLEIRTIVAALRRVEMCSDILDNGKSHGRDWTRREQRFIDRCPVIENKLRESIRENKRR